jgi:hypothetical protein
MILVYRYQVPRSNIMRVESSTHTQYRRCNPVYIDIRHTTYSTSTALRFNIYHHNVTPISCALAHEWVEVLCFGFGFLGWGFDVFD